MGELEITTVNGKAWYSKIKVGGELVDFKLDTGTEANIIPRHIYERLLLRGNLENTNEVLSSYWNHKVIALGKVALSCTVKDKTHNLLDDVASVPILRLEACTKFDLVKRIDSLTGTVVSKETILHEYKGVFEGLGCMPQEYHIEIQQMLL